MNRHQNGHPIPKQTNTFSSIQLLLYCHAGESQLIYYSIQQLLLFIPHYFWATNLSTTVENFNSTNMESRIQRLDKTTTTTETIRCNKQIIHSRFSKRYSHNLKVHQLNKRSNSQHPTITILQFHIYFLKTRKNERWNLYQQQQQRFYSAWPLQFVDRKINKAWESWPGSIFLCVILLPIAMETTVAHHLLLQLHQFLQRTHHNRVILLCTAMG